MHPQLHTAEEEVWHASETPLEGMLPRRRAPFSPQSPPPPPCRLHACSDYHVMDVCSNCGLLISTVHLPYAASDATGVRSTMTAGASTGTVMCRLCESGRFVERVALPYVFKYLVSELAAMNIRCALDVA